MKKCSLKAFLFISLFLVFSSDISFSQIVAGKIILKEEADKLFGPVQQFVKMSTSQFEIFLNQAEEYLLFRFEATGVYIFNKNRGVLFSSGPSKLFSETDELKIYSVSVIRELLTKGKSTSVIIEKRQNVMSVTNGEYTMEYAIACPPFCADK